jgi:glucose-6-phosphate isomerase
MLNTLNPFNLGYLIATWEHRTFMTSQMLEINPFDQYGVSAGKIFTNKHLEEHGS